jgi:predicted RNA binding protein YcfA (HicA-like mRNA interferase family)
MTPYEAEKLLKNDGWYEVGQVGSHRHYKHPIKPGKVTIPFHPKPKDLNIKTLNNIKKQAGII